MERVKQQYSTIWINYKKDIYRNHDLPSEIFNTGSHNWYRRTVGYRRPLKYLPIQIMKDGWKFWRSNKTLINIKHDGDTRFIYDTSGSDVKKELLKLYKKN